MLSCAGLDACTVRYLSVSLSLLSFELLWGKAESISQAEGRQPARCRLSAGLRGLLTADKRNDVVPGHPNALQRVTACLHYKLSAAASYYCAEL